MRKGAVRGNRIGVLKHAASEVGVEIERPHHPPRVPESSAHVLEEVAFDVILPHGTGHSVKVQYQHVKWRRCLDTAEQRVANLGEARLAQPTSWRSAHSSEARCGLPPGLLQGVEAAAHL